MTDGSDNPHFLAVETWAAAAAELAFTPLVPRRTAGRELRSLHIHVRDHKLRELAVADRSLEAHYHAFLLSQRVTATRQAARALALETSYGLAADTTTVAGHEAHTYGLGPEVPRDDIDGRSPAVIVWADGRRFHLVASSELEVADLLDVAESLYD